MGAEQEHFKKLVEEKLGNRSFVEKYLIYGVTRVFLLGILIVLGRVYRGITHIIHDEIWLHPLFIGWASGSIALMIHSYSKFKEFTENHEQKQKDQCELEIRN